MGLDGVEIVMAIEEAFDIRIEDAEAVKIVTPGDLIEMVMTKVQLGGAAGCLTQRSFNLVRSVLLRDLPLKRKAIAPATPMAALVAKPLRRKLLEQWAVEFQTGPFPALVRPRWLVNLLSTACVVAGAGFAVALHKLAPSVSWRAAAISGALAAVAAGYAAAAATRRWRLEFPFLAATVGDAARFVTAHKGDWGAKVSGRWTREQVAARVREIVIDMLACEAAYREDASFVQDLGMG